MKNAEIEIPDKCRCIRVVYKDGSKDEFQPTSKVTEWEDCYEFKEVDTSFNLSMVVIMKSEIRTIRFMKDGQ